MPESPTSGRGCVTRPVRHELDGDFTIAEIAARVGRPNYPSGTKPRAREGEPSVDGVPAVDLARLHAFETSALCRPPIAAAVQGLDPVQAAAWLELAQRWLGLCEMTGDLRFLNGACKLIGAVWIQFCMTPDDRFRRGWEALAPALSNSADLLATASQDLTARLNSRIVPITTHVDGEHEQRPMLGNPAQGDDGRQTESSLVVLAQRGSGGARRLLAAADDSHVPIRAVCWYQPPGVVPHDSSYSEAWYPAEPQEREAATAVGTPSLEYDEEEVQQDTAGSWPEVADILRRHEADLVILVGMPIVPADVLAIASLGVVNAHNGALPGCRGMDAVGWAVLNNEPIVCTLHLASPDVDQGDVLSQLPVPLTPAQTLRSRVKSAQLILLLLAAKFVSDAGRLPDAKPQSEGRQFYRLHPHLKRILDDCSAGWTARVHAPTGTDLRS